MIIAVVAVAFALLLGTFIYLVLPLGRLWQRTVAASVFLMLVAVVFGGSIEILSRPKPLRLEWRSWGWLTDHAQIRDAKVLGAAIHEGKAIHVWIQFPGVDEPRSYTLPWDTEIAQQLQNAMQEGEANGTEVKMSRPFDPGLDDREPKFYAAPQMANPDKNYSNGNALVFEQPNTAEDGSGAGDTQP